MAAEKHPREETMVWDLDVTRQALRVENWEAERLRLCFSAMETALTAADRESAMTEAGAG
jgi:hypothetical protein